MIEQLEKAMSLYNTLQQQADHATTEHGVMMNQQAANLQLQTAAALAQVVQAHMLKRIADALDDVSSAARIYEMITAGY